MIQQNKIEHQQVKISEQHRVIEHQKDKYHQISKELIVSKKALELIKKENKNKKQRLANACKSIFGAVKAEISCIKATVRSEIDT